MGRSRVSRFKYKKEEICHFLGEEHAARLPFFHYHLLFCTAILPGLTVQIRQFSPCPLTKVARGVVWHSVESRQSLKSAKNESCLKLLHGERKICAVIMGAKLKDGIQACGNAWLPRLPQSETTTHRTAQASSQPAPSNKWQLVAVKIALGHTGTAQIPPQNILNYRYCRLCVY